MLKLNGKLFRFTREGTYIYDIQNNFFKKADPQPPHWHALKIYLWKELLPTEKINPSKWEVLFLYPMKTRIFSGKHRKATACNGLSKNHNRKKKGYSHEISLFDACFLIIYKRIKWVSLTPYNHHFKHKSCQH